MRAPIANLDAMAGFSAPICSAVRSESFKSPMKEGQNSLRFLLQYPALGIS